MGNVDLQVLNIGLLGHSIETHLFFELKFGVGRVTNESFADSERSLLVGNLP